MSKLYQHTMGRGKSIVLVHGWAMHSGVWRNFAEQLAQKYCVTCIDLPGHGYSEPCDEFTLAQISKLLVNTVDVEKSCWLGWSLGATVVLDLAARYPERVDSLILLAGNPKFVQSPVELVDDYWPGMAMDVFDAFACELHNNPEVTLSQFLSLQIKGSAAEKATLRQLKELLSGCAVPCQNILQKGLALLKYSDVREVLTMDIPVSVILGVKDALVPVDMGQYLCDNYPKIQLNIIENAGHALFLSHQQEVLAVISQFMDVR